jgi:ferric-dicitrate binding protein FerR (iron transport regulator)
MAEQAPFKELMRRYFLGLLSPEEKERFAGLLRESIENRRAFLREAQITSVIHEWAIQQLSEPEPGSPKPAPSTKSLRSRGTPEKKGKRLWKPLGVAASLLLAILAAVFLRKDEVPSPVARLESLRGKVLLVPGRSPAAQGQDLLGGQGLETVGQGSRAGLVFSDATRLELGPDSALPQIEDRDSGKRVSLGKGTLVANVARQPAGHPMVFTTPQGEARVLGTTLRILVDPDPKMGTRLEV